MSDTSALVPQAPSQNGLEPPAPLVRSAEGSWEAQKRLAADLIASGFCPSGVRTPAQVVAIIRTGQEIGIPMMQALRQIHVIQGRPTMAAELILGRMLKAGVRVTWVTSTDTEAVMRAERPALTAFEGRFTMEEARRAGLTTKDGWRKYPAAMLRARVIALVARVVAPDIIGGLYTPEEIGADVDADGVITSAPAGVTVIGGEELPALDGSPFEWESWQKGLEGAPTEEAANALWQSLTGTYRGTYQGFAPAQQARLAQAWQAARAVEAVPTAATEE